jgi:hypothetical protein
LIHFLPPPELTSATRQADHVFLFAIQMHPPRQTGPAYYLFDAHNVTSAGSFDFNRVNHVIFTVCGKDCNAIGAFSFQNARARYS